MKHHSAEQACSPARDVARNGIRRAACFCDYDCARALGHHDEPGDEAGGEAQQREERTVPVDIRGQMRMRPTGMEALLTVVPRTVRSQVRFMEAALRIAQKLCWVEMLAISRSIGS
jgi:hypothetical protein